MGGRDRQIRKTAVTTRGKVWGHNYSEATETDMSQGVLSTPAAGWSDLANLIGLNTSTLVIGTPNPQQFNVIRILKPHYGELVEAYLDFQITGATNDGISLIDKVISVKFAIGQFMPKGVGAFNQVNDLTQPLQSYTQSYIDFYHKLITGTTNPFTSSALQVTASKLNLMPALNYYMYNDKQTLTPQTDDAFALVIQLVGGATGAGSAGNFLLNNLKVTLSTTGVT